MMPFAPAADAALRLSIAGDATAPHQGFRRLMRPDLARPDHHTLPPEFEPLATFLALADRPVPSLVEGVIPGSGITLLHGQPRTGKSWLDLDLALCVALGKAFIGERAVAQRGVILVQNEDSRAETAERLRCLLRGHGVSEPPKNLAVSIARGVSLDDPAFQRDLITCAKTMAPAFVILDPLRAMSACVDRGPSDLQPLAVFLRRLTQETGCATLIVHHDVKPAFKGRDGRATPHLASGGGLFSISEAPIHLTRDEATGITTVTPAGWKHGATPAPMAFQIAVSGEEARLVPAAVAANTEILAQRVLAFVRDNPGASANAAIKALKANRNAILLALQELEAAGRVRHEGSGRASGYVAAEVLP